jgi:dTDP-4-amino-4,6-dideoxygalactose transaminase
MSENYLKSCMEEYNLKDPWNVVELFEKTIASYTGAKYAISTDCCSHAIFLSLKILNSKETEIEIPERTYISVPSSINLAGYKFKFVEKNWQNYYFLEPLKIIDSATHFAEDMYVDDTLMCISFHYKKILPLGRGGMILTDSEERYNKLKKMRYDGRDMSVMYSDDDFDLMGYHMYMTPEIASYGMHLFKNNFRQKIKDPSSNGYRNLKNYISLFNKI